MFSCKYLALIPSYTIKEVNLGKNVGFIKTLHYRCFSVLKYCSIFCLLVELNNAYDQLGKIIQTEWGVISKVFIKIWFAVSKNNMEMSSKYSFLLSSVWMHDFFIVEAVFWIPYVGMLSSNNVCFACSSWKFIVYITQKVFSTSLVRTLPFVLT